jgi:SSS family solute:Na+ symporter
MFWRRTTGHGAFWGLVAGTLAASLHYEVTAVVGGGSLIPKLAVVHEYASDMAQNFWGAIWAWTVCFVVTIAISVATSPKPAEQLKGLVYGLTPHESDAGLPWHHRPGTLAVIVIVLLAGLNVIFW